MKKIGLIAAIAALICGFLVYTYISDLEKKEAARAAAMQIETVKLVQAAKNIPPYTDITAGMLVLKDYPAAYVPANSTGNIDDVVGKRCDGTLFAGQIILTNSLQTSEDIGTSMSFLVPEGKRAMTVSFGNDAGVGGYLTVGDYVDIIQYIYTEEVEGDETSYDTITSDSGITRRIGSGMTSTVLEGVQILAIGNNGYSYENDGNYSSVTFALTPNQCDILLAAREGGGSLTLTLRHRGEANHQYDDVSTLTELMD